MCVCVWVSEREASTHIEMPKRTAARHRWLAGNSSVKVSYDWFVPCVCVSVLRRLCACVRAHTVADEARAWIRERRRPHDWCPVASVRRLYICVCVCVWYNAFVFFLFLNCIYASIVQLLMKRPVTFICMWDANRPCCDERIHFSIAMMLTVNRVYWYIPFAMYLKFSQLLVNGNSNCSIWIVHTSISLHINLLVCLGRTHCWACCFV